MREGGGGREEGGKMRVDRERRGASINIDINSILSL